MAWVGPIRTSLLYDRHRQIRPAEFPTWEATRRHCERWRRDRKVLDELRDSVPRDGIREPLLVGVRERDKHVFVLDGHHRAVIALELKLPTVPIRWFWDPRRDQLEGVPFPYHRLGWPSPKPYTT